MSAIETPHPTKQGLFQAALARDEELNRFAAHQIVAVLAGLFLPLGIGLGVSLALDPSLETRRLYLLLYVVWLFTLLFGTMKYTDKRKNMIDAKFGLLCTGCGISYSGDRLTHLGFMECCSACGHRPFDKQLSN